MTASFWSSQRVIVTGGAGFLGSTLVETLRSLGCPFISVPRSREYDLREATAIRKLLETTKPTMVIHLAALCGGIGANQKHPGRFFYDNAIMGIQLMELSRQFGVQKFVQVGTVCAYPNLTPSPFREDDLWNGYPEETNAPYGLAKKMLLVQSQAYRQEYGFNSIYLLPANLYGPRDNFDLESSHVIPALIRKFLEAKAQGKSSVSVWGTGKASREFLYVQDAADGILLAAEKYNKADPCNLGNSEEITIKDLAEVIRDLTDFRGELHWDSSRPDGQPKRRLDISRAAREFGFHAKTSLRDGLQKTLDWYRASQAATVR